MDKSEMEYRLEIQEKTKIKICGLFRECDIEYVNETNPDYAGFVFYPPSHRFVNREQMLSFRKRLNPRIPAVGVFVDVPAGEVAGYLKDGLIQVAQLHGNEDGAYIAKLHFLAPGQEIWKAFRIRTEQDIADALSSSADRILLDNGYGTGKCFDWSLMNPKSTGQSLMCQSLTGQNPTHQSQTHQIQMHQSPTHQSPTHQSFSQSGMPRDFLLAGGLHLDNIEEALGRFHPWGVDISSGVETEKKKDFQKIRQIIDTIRRF